MQGQGGLHASEPALTTRGQHRPVGPRRGTGHESTRPVSASPRSGGQHHGVGFHEGRRVALGDKKLPPPVPSAPRGQDPGSAAKADGGHSLPATVSAPSWPRRHHGPRTDGSGPEKMSREQVTGPRGAGFLKNEPEARAAWPCSFYF